MVFWGVLLLSNQVNLERITCVNLLNISIFVVNIRMLKVVLKNSKLIISHSKRFFTMFDQILQNTPENCNIRTACINWITTWSAGHLSLLSFQRCCHAHAKEKMSTSKMVKIPRKDTDFFYHRKREFCRDYNFTSL